MDKALLRRFCLKVLPVLVVGKLRYRIRSGIIKFLLIIALMCFRRWDYVVTQGFVFSFGTSWGQDLRTWQHMG